MDSKQAERARTRIDKLVNAVIDDIDRIDAIKTENARLNKALSQLKKQKRIEEFDDFKELKEENKKHEQANKALKLMILDFKFEIQRQNDTIDNLNQLIKAKAKADEDIKNEA